ncbi:MAG: urea ABC transporter permease subunit UrtB [Chromatiales bacterium]|nr:urea ABC transporter permease subunit UrtB [Chromatiales bacterium]
MPALLFLLALASMPLGAQETDAGSMQDTLAVEAVAPDFTASIARLGGGNFSERREAAIAIADSGDERSLNVLTALLEGRLYTASAIDAEAEDAPPRVLLAESDADDAPLRDILNNESAGTLAEVETRRIPLNNALRGTLRNLIARLSLADANPAVRLDAAKRLLAAGTAPELAPLLRERLDAETDDRVRDALALVLALAETNDDTVEVRIAAVEVLSGALDPEVRARLAELMANDAEPAVQRAARAALDSIQTRIEFYRFAENLFFGLSLGSVLLLAAIGLAITFGVMGVINMAHGELIMIGAYTTWVVQQWMPNHIEWSVLVAIPAAFLVAGLVGVAIERGVIRFLYGRPLETLLATFGISLILQQAVRSIFSPLNRAVSTPSWMSGSLEINPVLSITWNRLYVLIFALIVFAALLAVLKKTSLGLKVRAVSQNRAMARACGVRADWVDAMTFGLGAGIAGVAGVALSQLTNVGPNLGQAYIIDSFMVVVFGGVGNLWGTLVGAMGLGVVNKFLEPWSGAVLAKILVLVLLILFIQKRPRGLFPQKGRAAEG